MSNYTAVVFANSETPRIRAWLAAHGGDGEVFQTSIGWNRTLIIISTQVEACIRRSIFFRGTAFDADGHAIVFGADGWKAATGMRAHPGDHNGEYCAIRWNRNQVHIDRDVFGNARLLTTAGPRYVAASDSLIVLASLRRALGSPLTVNTSEMLARTLLNNTAAQQMSPETMFNEISFVPAGYGITLTGGFETRFTGRSMATRLLDRLSGSYKDQVRQIALQISNTVAGLASIDGWQSSLSLSGGYDSRVVFGAARLADSFGAFTYSSANSSPLHARDFEVATGLATKFGMPRNSGAGYIRDGRTQDNQTLWAASLLGVYDGFGPARTTRSSDHEFTITGIGAELLKGNWGWRPFSALVEGFEPGAARDAYERQGRAGLRAVGEESEAEFASEVFYVAYRNGLHSAAGHIGVHMTGIHPLQQFSLARLGHSRTELGHAGSPSTIADISILIDPEVASYEYDTPDRAIAPGYASERLKALGGRLSAGEVDPLEVFGRPGSVPAGPSKLSLSIARQLGAVGAFTADEVISLGTDNLESLPSALRDAYAPLVDHARWRIGKVNGDVRSAGASTARLASLVALNLL